MVGLALIHIFSEGQKVESHEVIADGPATSNGEIALGKNALIGFTTWEAVSYTHLSA